MKKTMLTLTLIGVCTLMSIAQDDTSINVDVLKAPASPAMNMLGIAPSAIERPTDITAFMASIQNASGNFTAFPKNYAVEIAPFLAFKKTGYTLNEFDSTDLLNTIGQSFQISLGISQQNIDGETSDDTSSFIRSGIGIKFSLIRQRWSEETRNTYNALVQAQSQLLTELERKDLSEELTRLDKQIDDIEDNMRDANKTGDSVALAELSSTWDSLNTLRNEKLNTIAQSLDAYAQVRQLASGFTLTRKYGGYLDFASGLVLDFPDDRFNYSLVSKAGLWLTGGYDEPGGKLSVLGIARYLYNPDQVLADDNGVIKSANVSTFDIGARVLVSQVSGRLVVSVESLYRSVLNESLLDPSWRFVLNAEYAVGKNQRLTFAFGKNFDGTISKSGNLIAALNFIKGFGAARKTR